jgi:hypothetical protein
MDESGQKKTKAERIAARQARQAAGGQRKQGARAVPEEQTTLEERNRKQAAQDVARDRARKERQEQAAAKAEREQRAMAERQRQQAAQDAERERARIERNEQFAAQMEERKESNRLQDRRTALAAAANSVGPETPVAQIFKRAEELLVWLAKTS